MISEDNYNLYKDQMIKKLTEENSEMKKSFRLIQSMAGLPDAAEGCRLIIKEASKHLLW